MPKFDILKNGENDAVMASTKEKVATYMNQMFDADEIIELDGTYAFSFGSISVNIVVKQWHSEDVMVEVFAYLSDDMDLSGDKMEELLRLNATIPFGSFGLSLENSLKFSYSLAGKNLDYNEFSAAVQNVAAVADQYDEKYASAEA